MVDWQITATTFYCEAVADEVTLLVKPDWSVTCTGLIKYTSNRAASIELVKRALQMQKSLDCKGIDCPFVTEYKIKLQAEEDMKAYRAARTQ